ncbi:MAG: hypothetical protein LBV63_00645 [Candidatus Methanoplasma sp.]|jgi:hypothetical protein|nr:hypothetical protein [Candidatus Methanoplasma sp.]
MSKTTVIIAAIVVVVVIVAAVGAFFLLKGEDKDPNNVTFLVQDSSGVYFWIDGSGETVQDAFVDAFADYPAGTLVTSKYGVSTLFGVGTVQDIITLDYSWWGQFSWDGNDWTYNSSVSMPSIKSSDIDYFLVIYGRGVMGGGIVVPDGTPTPEDAVVWNGSTSGTVFTIASPTGLYFKINGSSSKSLIDAFNSACDKYKIPLVNTESAEYGQGIDSIYGLSMENIEGNWFYWAQYGVTGGVWTPTLEGMSSLKSADYPVFLVQYGGDTKSIPV